MNREISGFELCCKACQEYFWICRRCYRVQRYCSIFCRLRGRRESQRFSNRKHQQSIEGREDHRDRQKAYRARVRKRQHNFPNSVTEQSIETSKTSVNALSKSEKRCICCGSNRFSGRKIVENKSDLEKSRVTGAIGIIFAHDERWLEFFYSHKGGNLRSSPDDLLAESSCFAQDERILIKVALDLWTAGHYSSLSEIIGTLDWEKLNRVLLAVMTMRDVSPEDLADASSRYES